MRQPILSSALFRFFARGSILGAQARTRLSESPQGQPGANSSRRAFVSADGRSIAFVGTASDHVVGDSLSLDVVGDCKAAVAKA